MPIVPINIETHEFPLHIEQMLKRLNVSTLILVFEHIFSSFSTYTYHRHLTRRFYHAANEALHNMMLSDTLYAVNKATRDDPLSCLACCLVYRAKGSLRGIRNMYYSNNVQLSLYLTVLYNNQVLT